MSALDQLRTKEKVFVGGILGGLTQGNAYKLAHPLKDIKQQTASRVGHKWIKKDLIRQALEEELEKAGVNEAKIAERLGTLLSASEDKHKSWCIDRGLTHARAIMGLDAPKEQHISVDKREIRLTATASLDQLESLIGSTASVEALPPSDSAILDAPQGLSPTFEQGDSNDAVLNDAAVPSPVVET